MDSQQIIVELHDTHRMTDRAIASRIGVTPRNVCQLRRGERKDPRASTYQALVMLIMAVRAERANG